MVQLEPSLPLVLKFLAPSGAVLSAESTDYLIAEGYNGATTRGSNVTFESKYYFSQDGSRWSDLPTVDADTAAKAAQLRTQLTGDSAHQYSTQDATGQQAAEEEAGDGSKAVVTEVQRLRYMIDSINAATAVLPKGAYIANAHNAVVPNRLFGGLEYPDKLESYVHRTAALESSKHLGLAADVRCSWSVHSDSFKGIAVLRSLLYPGYCFYYSSHDLTWGGLYVGDGLLNTDLVFML